MSSGPVDGSKLCLACGLCCQGLLHDWARIEDGEAPLAERHGLRTTMRPEGPVFALPCHHHQDGCCAVYDERPSACRGYQCKLLRRYLAGELALAEGLRRVEQAKQLAAAIRGRLDSPPAGLSIWQEIRMLENEATEDPELRMDVAALLAFCQSHFRNRVEPRKILEP